jgi:hypothetical protein
MEGDRKVDTVIPALKSRGQKDEEPKGADTLKHTTNGKGSYNTEVGWNTL